MATTLVATRLTIISWSEHEARISLVGELASHLDVLATELKQPGEEWRRVGQQRYWRTEMINHLTAT
jgi:hypothetical protein